MTGSAASAAPQQPSVVVKDNHANLRLNNAIAAVREEVATGGSVTRRVGSSLRGWKNTLRIDGGEAGVYAFNKGTALVGALVLVPALAASIGTLGAAPLAALAVGLIAFASSKLYSVISHARDVSNILELTKQGDPLGSGSLDWNGVAPTLEGERGAATVQLAEKILAKLVSDVQKLDTEVDALLKEQNVKKPDAKDRTRAIATLLKEERAYHQNKTSVITKLHPLATKSGDISNKTDRAVHRLRRLRFYLRWLSGYATELEKSAFNAVETAKETERLLMRMALKQVSVLGNHTHCGDACWGPTDNDLQIVENSSVASTPPPPPPLPPRLKAGGLPVSNAGRTPPPIPPRPTAIPPVPKAIPRTVAGASSTPPPIPPRPSNLPSLRAVQRGDLAARHMGAGSSKVVDPDAYSKQEKIDKVVDKVIEKAGSEHAAKAVADGVANFVGDTVGEWMGGFVTDGISAAVNQARKTYRVNRPLRQRMLAAQEALHDGGSLDEELVSLAEKNDLKAVLRAFSKIHDHYPKRIGERVTKLTAFCAKIRDRAGSDNGFSDCAEMETALRYLTKVYHLSEKQLIHIYFFNFAVDAIDRQIFREAYKNIMADVFTELKSFDKSTLTHVTTKEHDPLAMLREINQIKAKLKHVTPQVADPFAKVRELNQAKANLTSTTTNVVDPLQAMKGFYDAWQATLMLLKTQLGATFINPACFAGDKFKTTIQPPKLGSRLITVDEWKSVSSIFLRSRSSLTQQVDAALEEYSRSTTSMITKYANLQASPNLNKRAVIEEMWREVDARMTTLRSTVKPRLDTWLNDKSVNEKSARRPAVLQLHACVGPELDMLSGAKELLADNVRRARELGL